MNDYHFLETVFNHLPFMIAFVDTEKRYRFINDRYANHFGIVSKADIIGKHVRDVLGQQLFAILEPNINKALGGQLVQYEVEDNDIQGAPHFFQGHIIGVFDRGISLGYIVVIQDITKWRKDIDEQSALGDD